MHFVKDECEINDKESDKILVQIGKDGCAIKEPHNDKILVKGQGTNDNFYVIEANKQVLGYCLMSQ